MSLIDVLHLFLVTTRSSGRLVTKTEHSMKLKIIVSVTVDSRMIRRPLPSDCLSFPGLVQKF